MPDINPLPVSAETRERLQALKDGDESYDDLLQTLVTLRHRSDLAARFHGVAEADAAELVPAAEIEPDEEFRSEARRRARQRAGVASGRQSDDSDDADDSGESGDSGTDDSDDADTRDTDGADDSDDSDSDASDTDESDDAETHDPERAASDDAGDSDLDERRGGEGDSAASRDEGGTTSSEPHATEGEYEVLSARAVPARLEEEPAHTRATIYRQSRELADDPYPPEVGTSTTNVLPFGAENWFYERFARHWTVCYLVDEAESQVRIVEVERYDDVAPKYDL